MTEGRIERRQSFGRRPYDKEKALDDGHPTGGIIVLGVGALAGLLTGLFLGWLLFS